MTSHVLDPTKARATGLCGAESGLMVDNERARCPDCLALATPYCVFCRIVRGQADADVVATGGRWVAFRPLRPHSPGHVLFVPRRHVVSAVEAPLTAGLVLAAAARYLRAQGPQGNLLTSSGPAATQTVDHLHVHVVPRGPADDLPADWPWMREGR